MNKVYFSVIHLFAQGTFSCWWSYALFPSVRLPSFGCWSLDTYPSCTGPMEAPAVRASSVIKARVIDSVVWLTPPSC